VRSAENNGGGMPPLWQRRVVATAVRERDKYGRQLLKQEEDAVVSFPGVFFYLLKQILN
jgi:hypothetical protein